jgi:Uma2 family endonuclease
MGSIRQILPHYTYEDYKLWQGRWEIIRGIAIAMSPMPNPRHQEISAALTEIMRVAIRESGCKKCRVYQPIDYLVKDDTVLNPDLLIVCQPIKGQYLDFTPSLIVEILSPSTALKDRNTKYDLYENEGVKYYIIVDPKDNTYEVYQLVNGMYERMYTNEFDLEGCQINFDIAECFEE